MEANGRNLIESNIPTFVWRRWQTTNNLIVGYLQFLTQDLHNTKR